MAIYFFYNISWNFFVLGGGGILCLCPPLDSKCRIGTSCLFNNDGDNDYHNNNGDDNGQYNATKQLNHKQDSYTLPFYYCCHAISRTFSLPSLALFIPVPVSFPCHNKQWIQKISGKQLFLMIFLVNLRPLYNNNEAKVSIVLWSRNWIFVAGSVISGIAKYLQNCRFQCNLKIIV